MTSFPPGKEGREALAVPCDGQLFPGSLMGCGRAPCGCVGSDPGALGLGKCTDVRPKGKAMAPRVRAADLWVGGWVLI